MKAVRVLGPSGPSFVVFEVLVKDEDELLSFLRTSTGPRKVPPRYASLQEAVKRNSRSTTTAEIVDVADIEEARAMVA